MRTSGVISLLTGLAISTAPTNGHNFEDLDVIDQRAAILASSLGQRAVAVDRRIKLPRCPELAVIEAVDANSLAARCLPLGWRVRIALTAGQLAVGASGTAALLVKRGDPVRLRVQRDGFILIYSVVAAANGREGDVIPVRAEGSRTMLQARLLGPGQAMLVDWSGP